MNDRQKVYARVNSPSEDMNITITPTGDDEDTNGNNEQYKDLPIVNFISQTFKKRECIRFVKIPNSTLCCCGYDEKAHRLAVSSVGSGREKWDVITDTIESPTDAFGELEILTSGQRISKYIRVDYRTSVDDLLKLMLRHWLMEPPNLLISVTGGAQNFTMKPRLKEVFRQGLVKAAESTRAWIITGGTNAGVMKHVGEAIHEHTTKHGSKKQLVALGIATWGCIENRENLISKASKKGDQTIVGCWPAQYKCSETLQKKKESPLDPNHTHFILVDNGTQQLFGVEIDLRAKLESAVSKMKTKEGSVSIPVVCVVLEGGPNTLETVKKAIETGTPAIIVAGSGRAADILAYAYSQCKEVEVEVEDEFKQTQKQFVALYDDKLWEEVAIRIKSEFKKTDEAFVKNSVACVRACINKIDHLTVFRLDGGSSAKDIDVTILRALLKVNRGKRIDQLRLALAWDRVDVAKEEIFTDGVRFEDSDLHDLMFFAIVNNRVKFVKLFLEKGVSLKEFLTLRRLHELYNDPITRGICVQLEKKAKGPKKEFISLKNVGSLMKELSGELFEPEYYKPEYNDPELKQNVQDSSTKCKATVNIALGIINPNRKEPFAEPARDLFVWSILHRMKDMAMVFWYEGKETMALAVVGHLLLKGLLEKEQDPDQAQDLQEQVSFFEELAFGILSECHSSDQHKTMQLLVRQLPFFGKTTTLEMAVQSDNKNFVAHPACQNRLTEIWTGKLADDNHKYKLIISVFCPPIAPAILKYKERNEESRERSSSSRESAARSSIDYATVKPIESQTQLLNGSTSTTANRNSPPNTTNYFGKIGFFFRAPVIKFSYSCIAYFAFILLYGIILLTDFYPTIRIKEQILIAWVATIILEEIRQIAMDEATELRRKLYNYITDNWNILDVITIGTFIAGMILRFIPVPICADCFYASRIILAINFMTFFFRILHMFSIHRELGPKLVMIGQMMIDLFYFMIILMVFIAAYGIASHVILYPNQPLDITLARDVLSRSWWNIFGELGLDEVSGESCKFNDTGHTMYAADVCASMDYAEYSEASCAGKDDQCPAINWLVPIILAIYALVTNVLMLNLLIAMFSYTFSTIQGQTNLVWKMQRYDLVREYDSRPFLPPPLIFIVHVFLFLRFILRRMNRCPTQDWCLTKSRTSGFRATFTKAHEEKDLLYWENVNAEEFLRKKEADECESVSNKTRETNERVDLILQKVEEIAETNFLLQSSSPNVQPQLPPVLEDRFQYLEKQMQRTSKALDLILQKMELLRDLPDVDKQIQEEKDRQQKEAEQRIADAKKDLQKRMTLHKRSRDSIYPKGYSGQSVSRCHVPDEFVSFETPYPEYAPEDFTVKDASSLSTSEDFNESWVVPSYGLSDDGYPLNPKGRTGLRGRGILPHWGPNHFVTVVVTRWKNGEQKKLLEFISIQRQNGEESIPELEVKAADIGTAVRGCFEKILKDAKTGETVLLKTKKEEVYKGYLDDYRNTDNAWIETVTLNYHIEGDKKDDDDTEFKISEESSWKPVRSDLSIYGPHLLLLQYVAKSLKATF